MTPSWLEVAERELGVTEIGGKRHNPRIVEYHRTTTLADRAARRDETPWCSSFVNWCLIEAGFEGTDNALARSWLDWGLDLSEPKPGAITVIKRNNKGPDAATGSRAGFHVGFFVSVNPHSIRLLGGNQRNKVKYSNYPRQLYDVKGYRWPILRVSPVENGGR